MQLHKTCRLPLHSSEDLPDRGSSLLAHALRAIRQQAWVVMPTQAVIGLLSALIILFSQPRFAAFSSEAFDG